MIRWNQIAPELNTDLYELTMAESFLREGMTGEATFSLFTRTYPADRSYFVAAGIEELLDTICELRFDAPSIDYLASLGKFSKKFLTYLRKFRFSGSIRALPEGRVFFTHEPIMEVTAPIIEAQIIETMVINSIHFEILVATKASRCVRAAAERPLIDFSLRRTHGVDAGLKVARGSMIAGFAGTSNLLAGKLYGIPVYGTMAHSYVTSFESELDAFFAFVRAFPDAAVLLIDTYDTICGARKAIEVANHLRAQGKKLIGVRLDSGDLTELSRQVRQIFIQAGLGDLQILASGSLDEYSIQELTEKGAEIDSFAVGTKLGVSAEAPFMDAAYKLVEFGGKPALKLSSGKKTWPGKKQVFRFYDSQGIMKEDLIVLSAAVHPEAEPLLMEMVENGERLRSPDSLQTIRDRFRSEWKSMPEFLQGLSAKQMYSVAISQPLKELNDQLTAMKKRQEIDLLC